MKIFFIVFIMLIGVGCLDAQQSDSTAVSKYRLSLTYSFCAVNPEDINNHIASSNASFGSTTKSIQSLPELSATFSVRPREDAKIILLRAGYLWAARDFSVSIPETDTSSAPIGRITGKISETYSAYPFSIGVGLATLNSDLQLELEFIYAVGYIRESGALIDASGNKTSYSNSLSSPAYGFRIAGQTAVPITQVISLYLEVAYRGLSFNDFTDQSTAQSSSVQFSLSGVSGNIGLTLSF
jgi:hypothetical protein